jgi:hypothetical protein
VLDLHYKRNRRKQLGFDGIFVTLSWVRSCSSIHLIIKHTHTPTLKKPMDTFQDPSQLLMWLPFTEASQAIDRRDKFGAWNWHLVQQTNPIYPIVFY